jgi:tetratricopeptide (TPR) repeat protein
MRCLWIGALLAASRLGAQQDTAAARAAYEEGRAAMREEKFDRAAESFERAVRLNPASSEHYLWLGHAYTRQLAHVNFIRKGVIGRRIGPLYDKAVELDSGSAAAAEARVSFYLNAPGVAGGSVEKARAEVLRLRGLDAYRGGFGQATLAEHEKDWDQVQAEFQALMVTYPDSATPYFYFGRAAALSGKQLSPGASALRKFLELLGGSQPRSRAIAHYRLGMIHEKLSDPAAARAQYDSAIALYPGYDDPIKALRRLGK